MAVFEQGTWEGLERWRLSGEEMEAEFLPQFGGQVISLKHRPTGLSLLREPKSLAELKGRPFLFGIPVLFLPGRLRQGSFELGGRRYQWPKNERGINHLHGFVWGKPWTLTVDPHEAATVHAKFEADAGSETALAFSHPFRLTIVYRLEASTIRLDAEVENMGRDPMPVGLGYHTTFNLLGARQSNQAPQPRSVAEPLWRRKIARFPLGTTAEPPCDLQAAVNWEHHGPSSRAPATQRAHHDRDDIRPSYEWALWPASKASIEDARAPR